MAWSCHSNNSPDPRQFDARLLPSTLLPRKACPSPDPLPHPIEISLPAAPSCWSDAAFVHHRRCPAMMWHHDRSTFVIVTATLKTWSSEQGPSQRSCHPSCSAPTIEIFLHEPRLVRAKQPAAMLGGLPIPARMNRRFAFPPRHQTRHRG
jgi:hypothetical protein